MASNPSLLNQTDNAEVRVYRKSDGKSGKIPANRLKDAIESGEYTLADPAKNTQPEIRNPVGEFLTGTAEETILPVAGLLKNLFTRPVETAMEIPKGIYESQLAEGAKGIQAQEEGRTSEAFGHTLASGVPMFGPQAADIAEEFGTNVPKASGRTFGALASLGLGPLLRRVNKAVGPPKPSLEIGGKPFPATVGTLSPESLAGKLEGGLEKIPVVGSPIRKKLSEIMEAGKQRISQIARETRPGQARGSVANVGNPSRMVSDVDIAADAFRQEARTIYRNLLGPDDAEKLMELQSDRQVLKRTIYGKRATVAERAEARTMLAETEQKIDTLMNSSGAQDARQLFDQADSFWRQGSAIEDFGKNLKATTRGLPEAEQAAGAGKVSQRVLAGSLLERVKKMNESGRLAQAFGADGAKEITELVEQMNRAKPAVTKEARIRQVALAGGGFAAGVGGTTFISAPLGATVAVSSYVLAKALANPGAHPFLRALLKSAPGSAEAAFWSARLGRVLEGEPGAEIEADASSLTGRKP